MELNANFDCLDFLYFDNQSLCLIQSYINDEQTEYSCLLLTGNYGSGKSHCIQKLLKGKTNNLHLITPDLSVDEMSRLLHSLQSFQEEQKIINTTINTIDDTLNTNTQQIKTKPNYKTSKMSKSMKIKTSNTLNDRPVKQLNMLEYSKGNIQYDQIIYLLLDPYEEMYFNKEVINLMNCFLEKKHQYIRFIIISNDCTLLDSGKLFMSIKTNICYICITKQKQEDQTMKVIKALKMYCQLSVPDITYSFHKLETIVFDCNYNLRNILMKLNHFIHVNIHQDISVYDLNNADICKLALQKNISKSKRYQYVEQSGCLSLILFQNYLTTVGETERLKGPKSITKKQLYIDYTEVIKTDQNQNDKISLQYDQVKQMKNEKVKELMNATYSTKKMLLIDKNYAQLFSDLNLLECHMSSDFISSTITEFVTYYHSDLETMPCYFHICKKKQKFTKFG